MTCVAGAVENETEVRISIFGKRSRNGGRRAARRASRGKNLRRPPPYPLGPPQEPADGPAWRALGLGAARAGPPSCAFCGRGAVGVRGASVCTARGLAARRWRGSRPRSARRVSSLTSSA